ncbi:polyhydroxyalkanoate synthase [Amaricoccus macauensis]|uniref:Polyhydroxyalkanoate synthase n=1 Tax=Amaricoccus macauensis TaxID=57001 RepID=A0A840SSM4_9RHOB|nr:class I poly(R)-hydroxyalkanoic acid synthase [Amaricoccus macauensis]MBB5223535.1 polyhydroxyalkanoate synthase [Amaricoccus macauensis]
MADDETNDRTPNPWELVLRAQRIALRAQTNSLARASGKDFSIVDAKSVSEAFMKAGAELAERPMAIATAQQEAWAGATRAWLSAFSGETKPVKDRRFRDKRWDEDPVSRGLRDAYLAVEEAVDGLVGNLPKGSKEALRAEFYTRQFLSALSPANFLMLNPAARDRFVETEGRSLLDGIENLLNDLEAGDGRLDISTNDRAAFEVGRDLATTPGKIVYQNELMQLIQYEPRTETQRALPILFVPAWINKYYILDMRPKNSLVRYMLDRGHSVFVISWINPTKEHADMSFQDYMHLGPLAALDAMAKATGERRANVLGFCIGGILVTSTLAYLAAKGDDRIAAATTLATMVDFADVGEVGVFVDRDRLKALEEHMADTGFLENHHLQDMFSMIRENDLVWSFHVMNYLMGRRPPAFDLLFWNSDSTRLPAKMLLWYLEKIYIENGLRRPGYLSLDDTPIDISKIQTPVFVLATKEDHIAPWTSVYPVTQILGGEVKFVLGGSGHIAGVVNPPAEKPKYGYWTRDDYPATAEEWLSGATYAEGSWWPLWAEWLEAKDTAEQVPARKPGSGKLKVIEDAPGTYVLARG